MASSTHGRSRSAVRAVRSGRCASGPVTTNCQPALKASRVASQSTALVPKFTHFGPWLTHVWYRTEAMPSRLSATQAAISRRRCGSRPAFTPAWSPSGSASAPGKHPWQAFPCQGLEVEDAGDLVHVGVLRLLPGSASAGQPSVRRAITASPWAGNRCRSASDDAVALSCTNRLVFELGAHGLREAPDGMFGAPIGRLQGNRTVGEGGTDLQDRAPNARDPGYLCSMAGELQHGGTTDSRAGAGDHDHFRCSVRHDISLRLPGKRKLSTTSTEAAHIMFVQMFLHFGPQNDVKRQCFLRNRYATRCRTVDRLSGNVVGFDDRGTASAIPDSLLRLIAGWSATGMQRRSGESGRCGPRPIPPGTQCAAMTMGIRERVGALPNAVEALNHAATGRGRTWGPSERIRTPRYDRPRAPVGRSSSCVTNSKGRERSWRAKGPQPEGIAWTKKQSRRYIALIEPALPGVVLHWTLFLLIRPNHARCLSRRAAGRSRLRGGSSRIVLLPSLTRDYVL